MCAVRLGTSAIFLATLGLLFFSPSSLSLEGNVNLNAIPVALFFAISYMLIFFARNYSSDNVQVYFDSSCSFESSISFQ